MDDRRMSRAALLLIVMIGAVTCSVAVCAQTGVAVESTPGPFAGLWNTEYGPLELEHDGERVTGTYATGTLEGAIDGGRLAYRYTEPSDAGEGWFELSADGNAIHGRWRSDRTRVWREWKGTRGGAAAAPTFDGLWHTTYGRMRLRQDGATIDGIYAWQNGSTIAGAMRDGRFEFTYQEPDVEGEGWFVLSDDGRRFEGEWRQRGATRTQPWIGTRIEPEPRRVWLVVLEAHWEGALDEPEYAFGDMLRSYFTMASARHVEVRHRFFHDESDFRRFCAEVPFLAEPVVLLVSTHGTPAGIRVGEATIGAEAIAESLRHASNVVLLHLSGCAMMSGDVPAEIHRQLASGPRFPISGYESVVAWDASALGDFTFLSFLLIHRFSPADAAVQARLASPYIGGERTHGLAYAPLGLRVLERGQAKAVAAEGDPERGMQPAHAPTAAGLPGSIGE